MSHIRKYWWLLIMIALPACSENETEVKKQYNEQLGIKYINGKPIECISYSNGITCNWDKYNNTNRGGA